MFPGDVGAVACSTACMGITVHGMPLPSFHANATEFRKWDGDEEVSLGDSHELGNRLIHLNMSFNYIMNLSLYLLLDFLTEMC